MESKAYHKQVNIRKKETDSDIEDKLMVTSGERERGRGKRQVGD